MPEAVIVSTARSPIGRAVKGSLKDMRPDDLTVQMVQAALAKVPGLDLRDITDLHLGVGQPAGEAGLQPGPRRSRCMSGMDHLPGVTVNRYCSSSLQTTRMAFHAIKAGEGDAFISAGVETVSRFGNGIRRPARLGEPGVRRRDRADGPAGRGWRRRVDRSARERQPAGPLHRDGSDRRERRAAPGHEPPGAGRVRRPQPEPGREGASRTASGPRTSPPSRCPTARS